MSIRDRRRRFDFCSRVVPDPEGDGFLIEITPDPSRYEWHEVNGEQVLFDKLDGCRLPPGFLRKVAEYTATHPTHVEPPQIRDAAEYVRIRTPLIRERLEGRIASATLCDRSTAFLEDLREQDIGFIIVSADLVASTDLWRAVDRDRCVLIFQTVQHEFSEVVAGFHGHVLSYAGDGLIAFFAQPTIMSKADLAIDCALTLHRLLYTAVNPLLGAHDLPRLELRIGMDVDDARVTITGSPTTKSQLDILGEVVSLTTKIQQIATPGVICVGAALERNLHTRWRKFLHPCALPSDWPHADFDNSPYQVFACRPLWDLAKDSPTAQD